MKLVEGVALVLQTETGKVRDWFRFEAGSWCSSLRLRAVDPGARGLLIDLMAYTWDTGTPGVLNYEDFWLFTRAYGYDKDDAQRWLHQLTQTERSPVQVVKLYGMGWVTIPKLVAIAVDAIGRHKLKADAGRLGGLASGKYTVTSGAVGVDPDADGTVVLVNDVQPSLLLEAGSGASDKIGEDRRGEDTTGEKRKVEPGVTRRSPKRMKAGSPYSEPFLRWYIGDGVEEYDGYPNKNGKRKAYQHWCTQALDARVDDIIEGTMRQIQERILMRKHAPEAFVPEWSLAKTFIYGERWEDTVLAPGVKENDDKQEEAKTKIMVYMIEDLTHKAFPDVRAAHEEAQSGGGILVLNPVTRDKWQIWGPNDFQDYLVLQGLTAEPRTFNPPGGEPIEVMTVKGKEQG